MNLVLGFGLTVTGNAAAFNAIHSIQLHDGKKLIFENMTENIACTRYIIRK